MANSGSATHMVPGSGRASASWVRAPEPLVPVRGPAPRRVSFLGDLCNGLVLGDFAPQMRLGGATMQIVCSFTPGVGTICALRDGVADLHYRDMFGFFLNLLALIPVFGGFAKTLHVLLGLWHVRHAMRKRDARAAQRQQIYYVPVSAVPTQRLLPTGRPSQFPPPARRR